MRRSSNVVCMETLPFGALLRAHNICMPGPSISEGLMVVEMAAERVGDRKTTGVAGVSTATTFAEFLDP